MKGYVFLDSVHLIWGDVMDMLCYGYGYFLFDTYIVFIAALDLLLWLLLSVAIMLCTLNLVPGKFCFEDQLTVRQTNKPRHRCF